MKSLLLSWIACLELRYLFGGPLMGTPTGSAGGQNGVALDAESLAELFTQHRAHLRRMVQFRLDDRLAQRLDPSDILQEAYVNALRRLQNMPDKIDVPPLVWLRQVTENTLIDLQRRHL